MTEEHWLYPLRPTFYGGGGPTRSQLLLCAQAKVHPEDGLLALRKGLELFANLRPVKVLPILVNST
ncbi:unnamed protein product, partial [marine sediment metagenome]